MWDVLGGILPSLITGGAGIFGSAMQYQGQQEANKMSAEESDKNRQFQLMMSNTAHQREVEDLRKAGLNPILSARYGGASTGSGSMAQFHNPAEGFGPQFLNTSRALSEVRLVNSQRAKTDYESNSAKHLAKKAEADAKVATTMEKEYNSPFFTNLRKVSALTDELGKVTLSAKQIRDTIAPPVRINSRGKGRSKTRKYNLNMKDNTYGGF